MSKDVFWVGSTQDDLRAASEQVRKSMGGALREAQEGGVSDTARRMTGNLRDVIEIRETDAGGTYRLMYSVAIGTVVYVLDFFQKKAKKGVATPQADLDRIERRLKWVRANHEALEEARNNG